MAAKSDTEEKEGKKDEKEAKGGSKVKLLIMVLPTVLLIAGAAYFFLLKPSSSAAAAPVVVPPPVPGIVLPLTAISINLAGGHYLKLSFTLQETADAPATLTGDQALDEAISIYSGRSIDELATTAGRERTKKQLIAAISKDYMAKVYDIYFTEFVMQ